MMDFRNDVQKLVELVAKESVPSLADKKTIGEYVTKILDLAEFATWCKDGHLKAFIAFYANDPHKDVAFISMIAVVPMERRHRLASSLLSAVLSSLRARNFHRCQLEVHRKNSGAIHMYEQFGFSEIGSKGQRLIFEVSL